MHLRPRPAAPSALLALLLPLAAPRGDEQATLLTGVHLVDLEAGSVRRDQALVLVEGRIQTVGPAAEVQAPAGARRVEGGGRYVLPGLFDMHVHLSEEYADETLTLFLANGITTAQSMHGSRWHLELRGELADGKRFGPRLFTTGPTTATLRVHEVDEAERVVRAQKAAGYDAVKMYGDGSNTMPLETYRKLVATGHEIGMRIVGHAPRNLPFAAVLEARQDSIDHMEELVYTDEGLGAVVRPYVDLQFGRTPFLAHGELLGEVPDYRPPLAEAIADLARRAREAGLAVTPTLVTFHAIQQSIDTAYYERLTRPEMRYVPPTVRDRYAPDRARFRNGGWKEHLGFMARALQRSFELQGALTLAFQRAGVPLMTGTDAPFDFVVPGFALHEELALFVEAGLTPLEALRAATVTPARILGLEDGSGTLRPGARADLVLLEADPLADIAATRGVAGVFQAGAWHSPEELAGRLAALEHGNEALLARMTRLRSAFDRTPAEAAASYAQDGPEPRLGDWLEDLLNRKGYEHLRAKRLDQALECFRAAVEAFPDSPNAWDSLGECCLERGELEEALAHYEHVLALDDASAGARAAIDRIVERLAETEDR